MSVFSGFLSALEEDAVAYTSLSASDAVAVATFSTLSSVFFSALEAVAVLVVVFTAPVIFFSASEAVAFCALVALDGLAVSALSSPVEEERFQYRRSVIIFSGTE